MSAYMFYIKHILEGRGGGRESVCAWRYTGGSGLEGYARQSKDGKCGGKDKLFPLSRRKARTVELLEANTKQLVRNQGANHRQDFLF